MIRISLLAGAALLSACATTKPEALPAGETAIPFLSSTSELEWKVSGEDALYLRGGNGDWYFIRTQGPCPRLRSAVSLGFESSAGDQLDRFGAIRADGARCAIASIVRGDPPKRTGD